MIVFNRWTFIVLLYLTRDKYTCILFWIFIDCIQIPMQIKASLGNCMKLNTNLCFWEREPSQFVWLVPNQCCSVGNTRTVQFYLLIKVLVCHDCPHVLWTYLVVVIIHFYTIYMYIGSTPVSSSSSFQATDNFSP